MAIKILWLAPNFNHYKARYLNHFANAQGIDLTVLAGSGRSDPSDKELLDNLDFKSIRLEVPKYKFGWSSEIRKALKTNFKDYDWILIPAEKKNIILFLYAIVIRKWYKNVKLFSYNHTYIKPKKGNVGIIDTLITRFFYFFLDRVIFYTEESYTKAISGKLINPEKADWANNAIDTSEIEKHYFFELPPRNPISLVFIGRLIKSKKVDFIIDYFNQISNQFNENYILNIIGDGPEREKVIKAVSLNPNIKWHGTLVDEEKIAPIMKDASLVFVPGLSGLSINHAFAYGRPYATLSADRHGPEISYLKENENGFIVKNDLKKIEEFLNNRKKIEDFCIAAYETSKTLSIDIWREQIVSALNEKK